MIYSNFMNYDQKGKIFRQGYTTDYTPDEKSKNIYRLVPHRFSQLRSYRTSIFLSLDPKVLQDKDGSFFKVAADTVMYYPIM